jgi:hypothetical protein
MRNRLCRTLTANDCFNLIGTSQHCGPKNRAGTEVYKCGVYCLNVPGVVTLARFGGSPPVYQFKKRSQSPAQPDQRLRRPLCQPDAGFGRSGPISTLDVTTSLPTQNCQRGCTGRAMCPNALNTLTRRPLDGARVYLSGPGDRYGVVDPTPREVAVKGFHQAVREGLLELGAAVVRDRNIPGRAPGYDRDKVRFLLRTCDAIVAFCYGREKRGEGWVTSEFIVDEIKLAIESEVRSIAILRETGVLSNDLDRLTTHARTIDVLPEAPGVIEVVQRLVLEVCAEVNPTERQIFTVIPFAQRFHKVFGVTEQILRERTSLPVRRIKDILVGTATRDVSVIDAILQAIRHAPLVVLELSAKNPNCFFEAGIAVATGVPTIRLIREQEEIPFDVRHLGFVKYRTLSDLREKLGREADRFARDEVTIEKLG